MARSWSAADGKPLTEQDREEARGMARTVEPQDDPILIPDLWYPIFRDFHHAVAAETPDFDYLWLKAHRPELYRSIKAKEEELDGLGEARLSHVMAIMTEWRRLVLLADLERIQNGRHEIQFHKRA